MASRFLNLYEEDVTKNTKIIVKPSTELIPDEYDVQFNGNECVHIFVADTDLIKECVQFFKRINVRIPKSNVHFLDNYLKVHETLLKVAESKDDYSLLFFIFWGYSKDDGGFTLENDKTLTFRKTWSLVLSSLNTNFRDKPKVFLFNVVQFNRTNEADGDNYVERANPYEVPNEADLLIIYKHNMDVRESVAFMEELAETLEEFGETEDLCSIVSIIDPTPYSRPVLISTMLKKLYMIPSELRGHYLNLEKTHELTMKEMKKLDNLLAEVKREKMQSSPSFIRKMKNKISSSFKSKNNEKPKEIGVVRREKKIIEEPKKQLAAPARSISPRTSTDKNVRKSSVVKKISIEERKPWKP